tara:strand:+ start:511 stop:1527 length:1017 start_codon:yes stop_codon:yes gene_type:complete
MMKRAIYILVTLVTCFLSFSAHADVRFEKVLHKEKSWQVTYREWSDGLQQCVAENIQGDQVEFDLVIEADSITFGIFIGEDADEDEKNFFSFQVDNEAAWSSETPFFDNGWLILEMMDASDKVFAEVERQFRQGINFKHLNASGDVIASYSLIGSNAAIIALIDCEETYLANTQQSSISEAKEMLMGRPNNNFELGYENNTDDLLMTEFVPVGETVQDWSQMITIQSFIGYRPETLESFATRFTQLVINECSTSDQKIIWSDVQYGYDSLVLAITCQENLNTGLPEWMLVKAIQGDDALYLVQKAWKYDPDDGELENWFEELGSFVVCGKNNEYSMCS